MVDLCAGLGGFSEGARMAGFRPIVACDSWWRAELAYTANHPEAAFIHGDILDANIRETIVSAAAQAGGCDLLCAGPPCQGFSQLRNGRHAADDPRNRVILEIPSYIAALQPTAFLIENVPRFLKFEGGSYARSLLDKLRLPAPGLQYEVAYSVLDAAQFGVPQQRTRIIYVGVRTDSGVVAVPPANERISLLLRDRRRGKQQYKGNHTAVFEALDDPWNAELVTVEQALADLPRLEPGAKDDSRPYHTEPLSAYQLRMRVQVRDGTPVTHTGIPRIKPSTVDRLERLPAGGCVADLDVPELRRSYYSAYRRLNPRAPSTTISTRADCAYHYEAARSLSVREYARLQSIPDHYTFPVPNRYAYKLIGNAVPPLLVEWLLENAVHVYKWPLRDRLKAA